jgi:hypothetical protein
MKIDAILQDGVYELTLSEAPAGSIVELRLQNTMNGATEVDTVDVGDSGTVKLATPAHFGQSFSITGRLLDNDNFHLVEFTLEASEDGSLHYTQLTPSTT